MCHDFELPEVNCRTCAHSSPLPHHGEWGCERHEFTIGRDCEACDDHIHNPSMLNGIEIVSANQSENWMCYRRKDGTLVDTRDQ